jgi:signal transduction histidine kinase
MVGMGEYPGMSTIGPDGPRDHDAWVAGLAHEVRNRLNAMQIHLGILEQEIGDLAPRDGAAVSTHVKRIVREVRDLDDFVGDLLRFAQASAPKLETVELTELVTELATFLGPECASHGVQLTVAGRDTKVRVRGDRGQIKSALLNLVLNALQATPAGGRIQLEIGTQGQAVTIAVRDSGKGVPPSLRPDLFKPFTSRRPGGTGLGLAIADRIVASHGGSIEVDTRVGRGSTFTVILPRQEATPHG